MANTITFQVPGGTPVFTNYQTSDAVLGGSTMVDANVLTSVLSAGYIKESNITDGVSAGRLTIAKTGSTARTATFPDAAITVARTDAAQTFTGTQTFSGSVVVNSGTGVQSILTIAAVTGTGWSGIYLNTGASHKAWSVGSQSIVNEALDFTPATAAGGSTFTTPVFVITNSSATNGIGVYSAGYGIFGATALVGSERVRIAGGSAPGTPGSTDVLFGAGAISAGASTDSTSASTGTIISGGGISAAKNIIGAKGLGRGVTSTATAAGTTTITTSSTGIQIFTGTTTQSVQLPAANAFGAGISYTLTIKNISTGKVTSLRAGSDTIEGDTTDPILPYAAVTYASDGVSLWVKI